MDRDQAYQKALEVIARNKQRKIHSFVTFVTQQSDDPDTVITLVRARMQSQGTLDDLSFLMEGDEWHDYFKHVFEEAQQQRLERM